jgi:hypothetical protein
VSEVERRQFAIPPAAGDFDGMELSLFDPAHADDRHMLILAEHPELYDAIEAGLDEIHVDGNVMSPILHITMHEIVANQLWDDNPPEVWQTAQRLSAAGYERHEVLHMLASVVSSDVYEAMAHDTPPDLERTRAALAALPDSWEQARAEIPAQRHANRTERRAAARAKKHPR